MIDIEDKMIPTFGIYDSETKDKNGNKEKIKTIIHCFISEFFIDPLNPPISIVAKDGKMYKVVYNEFFIPREDYSKKLLKVVGSFQKHTYGSFVVIRISK